MLLNYAMNLNQIELSSERLSYRSVLVDDISSMIQFLTKEVTEHLIFSHMQSIEEHESFVKKGISDMKAGIRLICTIRKDDESILGSCELNGLDMPTATIGLWINQADWGKGYGTEILTTMINWTRENIYTCIRIRYPVYLENDASKKLVAKVNGKLDELIREEFDLSGRKRQYQNYYIDLENK